MSLVHNVEIQSNSLNRKICSVQEFLEHGGRQVIITTLDALEATLHNESGLWIGDPNLSFEFLSDHEGELD